MQRLIIALAAAFTLTAPATAAAQPGDEASLVEAQFQRWEAALESRNPATVAALFAPDGVLQPTVSNEVRTTPERIQAYFVDFLALSPDPTVMQREVRLLDDTTAIDAGVWSFRLIRDGVESHVVARYAFVWENIDGVWRIQLLHSSLMPEPVAP